MTSAVGWEQISASLWLPTVKAESFCNRPKLRTTFAGGTL